MSVELQDKVQTVGELIRSGEYQVDPVAVADAMLRRMVWDDVPDVALDMEGTRRRSLRPRLRGMIRVGRLVSAPVPPRASLSA